MTQVIKGAKLTPGVQIVLDGLLNQSAKGKQPDPKTCQQIDEIWKEYPWQEPEPQS
jgi:hypothetical protein